MPRLKLVDVTSDSIIDMIKLKEYNDRGYLPSEGELALKFDVSHSTIREAVRSLEVRGLVKRQHGKGILVQDTNVEVMTRSLEDMLFMEGDILEDLLDIRMILEPVCAFLAAQKHTDEHIINLKHFISVMEQEDISDEEYYRADLDFHIELAKASGNRIHQAIITAYTPILQELIRESCSSQSRYEPQYHYHRNILEAVASGEAEQAKAHMTVHLGATDKNWKATRGKEAQVL